MKRRLKFVIPGLIVLLALGFLGYKGFAASAAYYYEVGEFVGKQSEYIGKNVKLTGTVADGTVDRQGTTLRFMITDGQQGIPVVYTGVVPDTFKAGGEAVVEGKLNPAGTFEAQTLLAKCPSKYEPEPTKTPQQGLQG